MEKLRSLGVLVAGTQYVAAATCDNKGISLELSFQKLNTFVTSLTPPILSNKKHSRCKSVCKDYELLRAIEAKVECLSTISLMYDFFGNVWRADVSALSVVDVNTI